LLAGRAHRHYLGVRRRIAQLANPVVPFADHHAIDHEHRADRRGALGDLARLG